MLKKMATAFDIFRRSGWAGIEDKLHSLYRIPIPQSHRGKWMANLTHETEWWGTYLSENENWLPTTRLDPDLPLQDRIAALLPKGLRTVDILDVGAGPLTYVGKKCAGKAVRITAVDALADEYDRLLKKHTIQPLVRTEKLDAEKLTSRFMPNSFDVVFARNCIDHSYDPERAVRQMLAVVKPGCYVLMEHHPNEAKNQQYVGLHQWNFHMNDVFEFIIGSKRGEVNMSRTYAHLCQIDCTTINDGEEWLITRILKKP